MKWIKLFEDFKVNNLSSDLIKSEDIRKCALKGGKVFSTIIEDYPGNNPDKGYQIKDIDEFDKITINVNGHFKTIDLKDVDRIEY